VIGTNQAPENSSRERVLEDDEILDVWNACREDHYGRIVKLLLLTGQRKGEVAGMTESELDELERLWTISGERTKNRAAHKVPLSDAAFAIIESQVRVVGRDLLFGDGAGPFSGWSRCKARIDRRIAEARKVAGRKPMKPWVLHDLRRTVRTRLGKLGVTPHISEAVLNHLPATLVQTYDRHDYMQEKRAALETWASHLETIISGTVRPKGVSVRAIALVKAEAPRATFAQRLALAAK
jgi:integrase